MDATARTQRTSVREDRADRLARARAALGAAERSAFRRGSGIDRTALRGDLGGPTGLVPAHARPGEADAPARGSEAAPLAPPSAPSTPSAPEGDHRRLPVPAAIVPLIPYGSLRAGSSVAVGGDASTSLLLALAVSAMGEDDWGAIAGMPDLGLRSLLDAGADPARLAVVPGTSIEDIPQLPQVLSALVDGVGVLVLGPHLQLPPALWRTLTGRARTRDTLILAASPPDRADLYLKSGGSRWQGPGKGSGRLRRRLLRVSATGRGIHGTRELRMILPDVRGGLSASPSTDAATMKTASVETASMDAASMDTVPADAAASTDAAPALRSIRRAG